MAWRCHHDRAQTAAARWCSSARTADEPRQRRQHLELLCFPTGSRDRAPMESREVSVGDAVGGGGDGAAAAAVGGTRGSPCCRWCRCVQVAVASAARHRTRVRCDARRQLPSPGHRHQQQQHRHWQKQPKDLLVPHQECRQWQCREVTLREEVALSAHRSSYDERRVTSSRDTERARETLQIREEKARRIR